MNDEQKALAQRCLTAAEDGSMSFPEIVGALIAGGFESYAVDFRRAEATYFLPDGDSVTLAAHRVRAAIAPALDAAALREAIGEAQRNAPGYTYQGFCERAATAGCAGYLVSFSGRRALYVGRDAATHVERFPD
jgi:uncharacterized protein YbcV (DUF1398 family)